MNESLRMQTTKGIWMSRAVDSDILVLDVEGTDGQERGDDQDFERKSALFSLAVSELLIINMWENSVGLYNGANMGLIKVVLEVNLQLFQYASSPKTCLLFALRDYTGVTPLANLGKTLTSNLEKIWSGISKPKGKEDVVLSDYFDLVFVGLPHKVYAPDGFAKSVEELKARFYAKDSDLFHQKYHRGIPADGFAKFAGDVWDVIVHNRDLDLPTQQELLAQYRCDEIAKESFARFLDQTLKFQESLESGNDLKAFGSSASILIHAGMEQFDLEAGRYAKVIYLKIRKDLLDKFHGCLFVYFTHQLRVLHKQSLSLFHSSFLAHGKAKPSEFVTHLREARLASVAHFLKGVEEANVIDSGWKHNEELKVFLEEIDAISSLKRTEALERLENMVQKQVKESMTEPLTLLFSETPDDLWVEGLAIFKESVDSATNVLDIGLKGLEVDEVQVLESLGQLQMDTWKVFIGSCRSETTENAVVEKLRKRFESLFRYDASGLPRVWSPGDDVDNIFEKARESDLPEDIQTHDEFESSSLVLVKPLAFKNVSARFKREADAQFLEAKRSTVATTAKIPSWFILMTLLLGWNELMTVLRNPVLTLILVVFLGTAYIVYYTNLAGPMIQVARVTTGEFGRQIGVRLRDNGFEVETIFDSRVLTQGIHKASEFVRNATAPKDPRSHSQQVTEEIALKNLKAKHD